MNRIEELFRTYEFIPLSMGLAPVSEAKYLITHLGFKSVIYGAGCFGTMCVRMLRKRSGIVPDVVVDKAPKTDDIEGIPVINRDAMDNEDKVVFVAVGAYSIDENARKEIESFLYSKGAKFIVDMNGLLGRISEYEFVNYVLYNRDRFIKQYEIFEDELSRDTYYHYLKAILEGREYAGREFSEAYKYWGGGETERFYSVMDEVWVNCGSCFGDTIFDFLSQDVPIEHIFAIEGDKETFRRLCDGLDILPADVREKISTHNVYVGGNGETTIDEVTHGRKVTLINMDIEGAEITALKSAEGTISNDHPVLAICAYHKPDDLLTIPQLASELYSGYKFFLRKYYSTGGSHWGGRSRLNELVVYAVPEERLI
jgi:hypothetical protein